MCGGWFFLFLIMNSGDQHNLAPTAGAQSQPGASAEVSLLLLFFLLSGLYHPSHAVVLVTVCV